MEACADRADGRSGLCDRQPIGPAPVRATARRASAITDHLEGAPAPQWQCDLGGGLATSDGEQLLHDGCLGLHVCLTTLSSDEVGDLLLPSPVALGVIRVAAEMVAEEHVI